jgi:hypothetical protein
MDFSQASDAALPLCTSKCFSSAFIVKALVWPAG